MRFLNPIANALLKHQKTVLVVFALLALLSALLMPFVHINYNLSDYLPEDAQSTAALKVMKESWNESIPNLSILVEDISIPEALVLKGQIAASPGVSTVLWLNDVVDILEPLEMKDPQTVQAWYKNEDALFSVAVERDDVVGNISALKKLIGQRGILSGEALNLAVAQNTATGEVPKIMLFIVPLVLLILLASTSSWFEPVLFLITIGAAILINEGTNVLLSEVSFVTRSTSAILQLAVSMDYAVFLLHSFASFRQEGLGIRDAMAKAMVKSFSSIAASASTTILGFLVLVLMRFKIGPDMGIVLAKGILISFISVMTLLPVLAMATSRLMDATHHRPLLPSFQKFGRVAIRICIPLAVAILILIVPSFQAQKNSHFIYGSSGIHSSGAQIQLDAEKINSLFGQSVQMVLLVPEGDLVREASLSEALAHLPKVNSVISYTNIVGKQIPGEFLAKEQISQFRSGGYSRIILFLNTSDEGEDAFRSVEEVRRSADSFYGNTYHLLGPSVVNYDLKDTITKDNKLVTLAAMAAIGLVLAVTFKSLSIPLILLLTIQGATWFNLGIPYFTGDSLNYIGYQIISTVQLGATVDYGILFAQQYMANRQVMDRRRAVEQAVAITAPSILTPASILTISGMMLGVISSNGIVSQLGSILGRGALISSIMVLFVLPGLLILFDKQVQKTTFRPLLKEELKQ